MEAMETEVPILKCSLEVDAFSKERMELMHYLYFYCNPATDSSDTVSYLLFFSCCGSTESSRTLLNNWGVRSRGGTLLFIEPHSTQRI